MSRIIPQFWEFWSAIADKGSPKDKKLTLKLLATFKDPAKTVFDQKTGTNIKLN